VHRNAAAWRDATYAGLLVPAWIAGLVVLFVSGKALSRLTLQSIEHSAKSAGSATSSEIRLIKVYRQLIQVAGWYYYISLPFVILLPIAGAAAGVVYAFMALGRIPIRLVAILGLVTLGTIYKMVQSLFVKINAQDPGRYRRCSTGTIQRTGPCSIGLPLSLNQERGLLSRLLRQQSSFSVPPPLVEFALT
jgi:hypothetical protein